MRVRRISEVGLPQIWETRSSPYEPDYDRLGSQSQCKPQNIWQGLWGIIEQFILAVIPPSPQSFRETQARPQVKPDSLSNLEFRLVGTRGYSTQKFKRLSGQKDRKRIILRALIWACFILPTRVEILDIPLMVYGETSNKSVFPYLCKPRFKIAKIIRVCHLCQESNVKIQTIDKISRCQIFSVYAEKFSRE
jgi:hypothetical protein